MHATATSTPRTVDLEPGQWLSLDSGVGRIQLAHGQVWLTAPDDGRDVFLGAGDGWGPGGSGLLIGALAPTRLHVHAPAEGVPRRLVRAWHRAARALQQRVMRLQLGPVEVPSWP